MTGPQAVSTLDVRDVRDETVVHDTGSQRIHVLNRSAAAVLRLCDGRHSEEAIARELVNGDAALLLRARNDVVRILGTFASLQLIEP
ncbi:MAG TPA: PqqD family protein [Candidatus Dormibacteraeota bacterium]|nr:PqqD family protein [Candidatus Dormibacteraeota bacterium]